MTATLDMPRTHAPRTTPTVHRKQKGRWPSRLIVAGLSVFAVIWLIPIIYMVSVSLRTPDHAFDSTIISTDVTLANYETVFADNPIPRYFLNSLIISVGSTALVAACGLAFAYASAVLRLKRTQALQTILMLTLMVPISSLVIPLGALLKEFGWMNSYWGLIGPYAALGIPFAIVILVGFMHDLPRDVLEAAVIDGTGVWRLFTSVVIPMIRPSLIFVAVWQFITSWNEFFLALTVMTRTTMKPLPLVPQEYSGLYLGNPGALFAILTLVAAPLILMYLMVQRWFVGGLLDGAVKG